MRRRVRIRSIEHVPFETAANIALWAQRRGHRLAATRLHAGERLPGLEEFDWLAVMGGPMGVYQKDVHPGLGDEVEFIRRAVNAGKAVIGVCLGAQLLAEALGVRVYPHVRKEIGWFPVRLTEAGRRSSVFGCLPAEFPAFHWHGDTFDLPRGCLRAAESDATPNQAFEFEGRALGLQFHLDYSAGSIRDMVRHCADELCGGPFVQTAAELLADPDRTAGTERLLFRLLDRLAGTVGGA